MREQIPVKIQGGTRKSGAFEVQLGCPKTVPRRDASDPERPGTPFSKSGAFHAQFEYVCKYHPKSSPSDQEQGKNDARKREPQRPCAAGVGA